MADPVDPKFNLAHPPLMTTADVLPPECSTYDQIGSPMTIKGADMNRVTDKDYDWRPYLGNHEPAYHKKVAEIIRARDLAVDHYLVTRRRYWHMNNRYHYGAERQETVTKHVGITHHVGHTVDRTKTTTERLSFELGIDPSPSGAELPGGIPEVPPVALLNAGNGGLDIQFSRDMTETLHITDVDETTYIQEETDTVTQTFKASTTYIHWDLREECILDRFRKGQENPDTPPVSTVLAVTATEYWDVFPAPKDT